MNLHLLFSVPVICHNKVLMTEAGVIHKAGYVYPTRSSIITCISHSDVIHLSIFNYLGSLLHKEVDLMSNICFIGHIHNFIRMIMLPRAYRRYQLFYF